MKHGRYVLAEFLKTAYGSVFYLAFHLHQLAIFDYIDIFWGFVFSSSFQNPKSILGSLHPDDGSMGPA